MLMEPCTFMESCGEPCNFIYKSLGSLLINTSKLKLQCGDIGMERRQDWDGLYTWCSRMSDRITSQALSESHTVLYSIIVRERKS